MPRRLKKPSGMLIEEYLTGSAHFFQDGEYTHSNQDASDGAYTGRFAFQFTNGTWTRWYREKSAPKWLRVLWEEATQEK